MEHSTVNVNNGLSTVSKNQGAPIGESFALWNDPTRNRKASETRVVENLNSRRTHYFAVNRCDNFFRRIFQALGLARQLKASSQRANWHWSDVDTDGYIATIHCECDGRRYGVPVIIPPEHSPLPNKLV